MILYVLVVWGLVTAAAWALEVLLLAHHQQQSYLTSTPFSPEVQTALTGTPLTEVTALPVFATGGSLFLIGVILGWLCERFLSPVKRLYNHFQRTYPHWYQQWPAAQRELRLALILGLLLLGLSIPLYFSPLMGLGTALTAGLALGCLLPPLLRLRNFTLEDRPEKAPQALIHQWAPKFSLRRSLLLGQIYLRLLVPMFCLFSLLILPLNLGVLYLSTSATTLLLIALMSGLLYAWYQWRESNLAIESFIPNLLQLGGLMLVASAFLGFGVAADNLICLGLMGFLSGYIAGSY